MDGEITGITHVQVEVEDDSGVGKLVDVYPTVQVVSQESYEALKNIENATQQVRTKYYRQTYRPAWEQMPDFAGWLKGVEGEPTRAFCIYCQKTLHAHRLSLLKHTCTIRHQKAAQMHQMRKKKSMKTLSHQENETIILKDDLNNVDDVHEEEEDDVIEYTEYAMEEGGSEDKTITEFEQDQLEDEEEEEDAETIQLTQNFSASPSKEDSVPPISTQVTDSVRGVPISGLQVSLYQLIHGRWTYINEGFTNHNGWFSKFLDGINFTAGRYKLHYDVDRYFESKKQESLYPFIEIVFDYKGTNSNYHIPLILSPNGYTTYKGS
ncbi:hypothetical protein HHI36_020608 [Cryptolaemus montrouzieri]|uniref:hydroxyisourate hydrolase n=1 Tax=Cryptolaemus montrouzieri TaxID=559131 RepID=A0ABD2NBX5_9CUCU